MLVTIIWDSSATEHKGGLRKVLGIARATNLNSSKDRHQFQITQILHLGDHWLQEESYLMTQRFW